MDLETAISLAVTRALDQDFTGPGGIGKIRFVQLFEDWPSMEQSFVTPTAVVLPDGDLVYGPGLLTPKLLEDTWEVAGEPGLGLYELAEASREFQVLFRGSTAMERNALKAGIEGAFVADPILIAPRLGARYGTVVAMPEYWGLAARLTLVSTSKLDDAESASKNIWEGRISLRAEAKLVKLGLVQPFRLRITETFTTESLDTIRARVAALP